MEEAKRTLQGMTIKVGEIKYTIPITSIRQSLKAESENLFVDPDGNEMLKLHNEVYDFVRLYEFFNTNTDVTNIEDGIVMQLENGDKQLCIFADELIGETDITVYPLPKYLPELTGIGGCSIINDDEIYLIVDVSAFFDGVISENEPVVQAEIEKHDDEEQSPPELANNAELRNKYFTFEIDREEYGIEVAYIKEIIGVKKAAEIPYVPHYIDGLISLRDEVIPVINVRKRFHKASREHDALTCTIVVNYQKYAVGLIVDCVKEVAFIGQDDISSPPSAKRDYHNQFISKLGKSGDSIRQLIDLNSFLFK